MTNNEPSYILTSIISSFPYSILNLHFSNFKNFNISQLLVSGKKNTNFKFNHPLHEFCSKNQNIFKNKR